MGGLGFGSLAGGHLADRLPPRRRILAFALAELAISIFGFLSVFVLYDTLYLKLGPWWRPCSSWPSCGPPSSWGSPCPCSRAP
jgi:MFS family permease